MSWPRPTLDNDLAFVLADLDDLADLSVDLVDLFFDSAESSDSAGVLDFLASLPLRLGPTLVFLWLPFFSGPVFGLCGAFSSSIISTATPSSASRNFPTRIFAVVSFSLGRATPPSDGEGCFGDGSGEPRGTPCLSRPCMGVSCS